MFKIDTKTSDYMTIVVTHECNRKCPFCIDSYRGRCEFITLENVKRAITVAKTKKIKDILLVGGEPTLHPDICLIAKMVHEAGFNVVLTTNYTKPDIVKKLDKYVDSFNISYYYQEMLPMKKDYKADITLSTLIFKGQLDTKKLLDSFIDKYKDEYILKFSTLTVCNDFTEKRQQVDYLDELEAKRIILFNEIEGQIYRNCIIKRYDKLVNKNAEQSLKCHVDGTISYSWDRDDL